MKKRTPPSTAQEFVARLVELDSSVPLTDEDADVILREAGLDPDRELKRAMALIEAEEQRQRQAQMRLLAGLPLPPDVVAKLREADRLRKLFDDAGQGEHNVLALIDHYQRNSMDADERLRAVRCLLEENGCECPCDHHPDESGPDCEVCLACRIGEAVGK